MEASTQNASRSIVLIPLGFVLVVLVGCAALSAISRSATVLDFFESRQMERWKSTNSKYQYNRGFIDFEARMLYGEIGDADYSRGGVYFMGSSTVKNSLISNDLRPDEKELIRNYSISASSSIDLHHFLRFLIDEHDFVAAGGEKSLVVLGLFFQNRRPMAHERLLNQSFIRSLVERHGLYDYTQSGGIVPREMSALRRRYLEEKARIGNFLRFAINHMAFRAKPPLTPAQKAVYHTAGLESTPPNWNELVDSEVEDIKSLVRYLQSFDVQVAAYLSPLGSWYRDDYPPSGVYASRVADAARELGIPLYDLSALLADDEFYDAAHANFRGQSRIHPTLMKLAWAHLESTGIERPPATATSP